ncbi:baseplate J/gp47 family protein [Methylobacterium aquaticum]|uniref:baseplate J/gp47 family protein n=1 Tax=Methylobacterium aquaticum TaxID=270351 RepID=UPI003D17AB9B
MSRFLAVPLEQLPPLPLEEPSFDTIREARAGELAARLREEGFGNDIETLATDPFVIGFARAGGVREMLVLARRNDAVRSVMLASAWGAYLDHLGAGATPPIGRKALVDNPRPFASFPQDWERDDEFRRRIQLAPEMLSAAGPEGAYLGYALATPGVKMVGVWAPMSFGGTIAAPFTAPGEIRVPVVASEGDGTASAALCAAVQAELRPKDRRPVGDFVTTSPATILPYRIEVEVPFVSGVEASLFLPGIAKRLQKLAARQHRPGGAVLRETIKGACYVAAEDGSPLTDPVRVIAPGADVNGTPITVATPAAAYCAPYCAEDIVVRPVMADD